MNSMIKNLKLEAREALSGRYFFFALVTVLVNLLNISLTMVVESAFPNTSTTFNLVLFVAATILTNMIFYIFYAGAIKTYYCLCTGQTYNLSVLFSVFRDQPESVAMYSVLQCLLQTVVIWGGAKFWKNYFLGIGKYTLPSMMIVTAIVILWYIGIQLNLAMTLYAYCEYPNSTVLEMIGRSLELMRGRKMELFRIYLSFAGGYILSFLSLGIGLIVVKPYLHITLCKYYLAIKSEQSTSEGQTEE